MIDCVSDNALGTTQVYLSVIFEGNLRFVHFSILELKLSQLLWKKKEVPFQGC